MFVKVDKAVGSFEHACSTSRFVDVEAAFAMWKDVWTVHLEPSPATFNMLFPPPC